MTERRRAEFQALLISVFVGVCGGWGAGLSLFAVLDYLRDNRAYIIGHASAGLIGRGPTLSETDTSTPILVGLLVGIALALLAYLVQRASARPPARPPSEGEPSDPPEVSRPAR